MVTPRTGRPVGRPPRPTEQKRALGNPGKRAMPPAPGPDDPGAVVVAPGTIPTPPALGKDGMDLWITLWTAGARWLSPSSDITMVTLLCQAVDEVEEIRRSIAIGEVKRFYTLPHGQIVSHPLIGQMKDMRAQITAWLSALGFTPTDRARLGLSEVRQSDALDELTRRRNERHSATAQEA